MKSGMQVSMSLVQLILMHNSNFIFSYFTSWQWLLLLKAPMSPSKLLISLVLLSMVIAGSQICWMLFSGYVANEAYSTPTTEYTAITLQFLMTCRDFNEMSYLNFTFYILYPPCNWNFIVCGMCLAWFLADLVVLFFKIWVLNRVQDGKQSDVSEFWMFFIS